MLKKNFSMMLPTLVLLVAVGCFEVQAGNRADINSDHAVNAADAATLLNVLAGNIPVANYNLPSVVVVAPSGGDFTDPAAAADWVAAQSPSYDKPYIIYVAPGYYVLGRSITLPAYTTLKGVGREQTTLELYADGNSAPFGALVVIDGVDKTAIEDLSLYKGHGSGGVNNTAVYIHDCTTTIRNCKIQVQAAAVTDTAVYTYSESSAKVNISASDIIVYQQLSGAGPAVGLYFRGAASGDIRDTDLYVSNQTDTQPAYCIYQWGYTDSSISVYYSTLTPYANGGSGLAYYFYRFGSDGFAGLFASQIEYGIANTLPVLLQCFSSTSELP